VGRSLNATVPDEPVAAADPVPATAASTAPQPAGTSNEALAIDAVEIDRIVPTSGNLGVCGQQFWLGPQRAGRTLTLWIDTTTVHLSLDGQRLKTLPSRLTSIDLARLRAHGARPAGPPPARPSWAQLAGRPGGDSAHRQRHRNGVHRRQTPLHRPALRRPADHPAPRDHPRPRGPRRCPDPAPFR
jgi:hypothetical protein